MRERLEDWVRLADERLKGTDVKCFVTGGNDDAFEVEALLRNSDQLTVPEGVVCSLDDKHEMISSGYSNMTPWQCPRDIPDQKLAEKINDMTSQVKDMQNCVFNFHVPPYDSGIDTAPELDENLAPKLDPGGDTRMIPVGSKAVAQAIERFQPLLGLHGHIHESKGVRKLGRTLCVNPGSEYTQGILSGVVVRISDKKIEDYFFVSG